MHDKKLKWPILFQRFFDDGFGIMEGTKKDFKYWINQLNGLRKTITSQARYVYVTGHSEKPVISKNEKKEFDL